MNDELHVCVKCGVLKPATYFRRRNGPGRNEWGHCKDCLRAEMERLKETDEMIRCRKCRAHKPAGFFNLSVSSIARHTFICHDCQRKRWYSDDEFRARSCELSKRHYEANKESIAKKQKERIASNPNKRAEQQRKWQEKNRAKIKAYNKRYREKMQTPRPRSLL